jgi:hypothetical protein
LRRLEGRCLGRLDRHRLGRLLRHRWDGIFSPVNVIRCSTVEQDEHCHV